MKQKKPACPVWACTVQMRGFGQIRRLEHGWIRPTAACASATIFTFKYVKHYTKYVKHYTLNYNLFLSF